jgi:hypothetical protein
VIARFTRRGLEALVALFALLGFCFVPLGEKTALAHLAAIARTAPAAELGREIVAAAERVRRRLFEEVDRPAPEPRAPPMAIAAEPTDAGAGAPDASLPWRAALR